MPTFVNKPAAFENAAVEDADRFNKLPFYLVKNEIKTFPRWNIFDQLFGSIPWETNSGNTMRAVTPQASPVVQSTFFPNNITELPNKNVYGVTESTEDARVKAHRYESQQFSFVPYFNSFWRDHLSFQNKDIAKQIQVSNNLFIRTNLLIKSPYVYIAGVGLTAAPTGDLSANVDAATGVETLVQSGATPGKTSAWLAGQLATVKSHLSLRTIYRAQLTHREDLGAMPFDGILNMPKDNEGIKGKYVIAGSTEAWDMFPFDPDTGLLKSINLDLLFNDFNGLLFGKVSFKYDSMPLRMKADGTLVPPQVYNADTKKVIPNPEYTDINIAAFEVAWMLGADTCKTIKVGPPPKEFAAQSMSAKKFYSLKWNGEIQLTDQVLVKYANGDIDLNTYGTQLKFQAQTTHGFLPSESRYTFPIIFRRKRAEELV